jgi:hypothetical protein
MAGRVKDVTDDFMVEDTARESRESQAAASRHSGLWSADASAVDLRCLNSSPLCLATLPFDPAASRGPRKPQDAPMLESDPHRLAQRQKQIDLGKNTLGYQRYCNAKPRHVCVARAVRQLTVQPGP